MSATSPRHPRNRAAARRRSQGQRSPSRSSSEARWILAGDLWGTIGPSPGGAEWAATGFGALGAQRDALLQPANVFVSLTPSFTGLLIHVGEEVPDRKSTGFGAKLAVGKEWWVDDHWRLGVAAQGLFAFTGGTRKLPGDEVDPLRRWVGLQRDDQLVVPPRCSPERQPRPLSGAPVILRSSWPPG